MRRLIALLALAGLPAAALAQPGPPAPDIVGDWSGAVKTPVGTIPIAVHIRRTASGAYTGTLDSPSQAAAAAPLAGVSARAGALSFDAPFAQASYSATWDPGRGVWSGRFSQDGQQLPLDLARAAPAR